MDIFAILIGAIVFVMGRRLFWLLVGLLGFMAGIAFTQAHLADSSQAVLILVALAIGGVLGAVVAAVVMDWAIILLSSLAGAGMIVRGLALGASLGPVDCVGLVIVGMVSQAKCIPPNSTNIAEHEVDDHAEE